MTFNKMMKKILEEKKVEPGERIISSELSDEAKNKWAEIIEMSCRATRLIREFENIRGLLDAKKVLFWEDMRNSCEQAESSADRGMAMGIRYDDKGTMVLVEFPEEETKTLPDFLKGFFGGEEESDGDDR